MEGKGSTGVIWCSDQLVVGNPKVQFFSFTRWASLIVPSQKRRRYNLLYRLQEYIIRARDVGYSEALLGIIHWEQHYYSTHYLFSYSSHHQEKKYFDKFFKNCISASKAWLNKGCVNYTVALPFK
jgi:hypothetical protein